MLRKIIFLLFCTQLALAQNWDIDLLKKINPYHGTSHDQFYKSLSNSVGYTTIATPAAMLIYGFTANDAYWKKQGINAAASSVISFGMSYALKKIVNKPRPYVTYPNIINNMAIENSPSFPSTHTSLAFSTATSIVLASPKWYVIAPAAAYACGVGYSRIYMGVHYPSDVIVGAIIGSGSAFLSTYLNKKLTNYYRKKKVPKNAY